MTVKEPFQPHPHNLVGKERCEDGVCSVIIDNPLMEFSFSNLGIQCVKKRDIEASLSKREKKGIDPFKSKLVYFFLTPSFKSVFKLILLIS